MDVKRNKLTASNVNEILEWINSQSPENQALAVGQTTEGFERIYLPQGKSTEVAEPGDMIAINDKGYFYVAR